MKAPPGLAKLFLSLLMALAFTLLTRVGLAVYVNALQRHAQDPQMIHIRRLNAIVRYAQRNPLKLVYFRMLCDRTLIVHSDAGFRKEEKEGIDHGLSVRGANYFRAGKEKGIPNGQIRVHFLDLTSELQAAISKHFYVRASGCHFCGRLGLDACHDTP